MNLHGDETKKMKMGIILQQLIEPEISGVIYTNIDDNILIQYAAGFGDRLVDGATEGSSIIYSPNKGEVVMSKNTDLQPIQLNHVKTLNDFADKIKCVFANLPQDIEFAIKNDKVYILQARTLTTEISGIDLEMSREDIIQFTKDRLHKIIDQEKTELKSDSVILSDSNYSELLPKPKEMDYGVFEYIFTGVDGTPGAIQLGRQEMGYPLGNESIGFMYYIGGKPYFSIARDAHTFYAGFPESRQEYNNTLVKNYLEQIEHDPNKGEYPEMGLYLQALDSVE